MSCRHEADWTGLHKLLTEMLVLVLRYQDDQFVHFTGPWCSLVFLSGSDSPTHWIILPHVKSTEICKLRWNQLSAPSGLSITPPEWRRTQPGWFPVAAEMNFSASERGRSEVKSESGSFQSVWRDETPLPVSGLGHASRPDSSLSLNI